MDRTSEGIRRGRFYRLRYAYQAAEAGLGEEVVVGLNLGESPIRGDRYVDPEVVEQILQGLRAKGGQRVAVNALRQLALNPKPPPSNRGGCPWRNGLY